MQNTQSFLATNSTFHLWHHVTSGCAPWLAEVGSSLAAPVGAQGSAPDSFNWKQWLPSSQLASDTSATRFSSCSPWNKEPLESRVLVLGDRTDGSRPSSQVNLSKNAAVSVDDMAIVTPTQSPASVGSSLKAYFSLGKLEDKWFTVYKESVTGIICFFGMLSIVAQYTRVSTWTPLYSQTASHRRFTIKGKCNWLLAQWRDTPFIEATYHLTSIT